MVRDRGNTAGGLTGSGRCKSDLPPPCGGVASVLIYKHHNATRCRMPGGKGPTFERACDNCGTLYPASIRRFERGWDRSCSKSCANAIRARMQPKRRTLAKEYKRQNSQSRLKEDVRARAGYKCQICGISQAEYGRALDVHRIIPDGSGGEYAVSNARALCRRCHTISDRRSGAG